MSLDDAVLIARVVDHKDARAFEQLVLKYQSQARVWARRLSRGDWAAAEDIAQEAFIKVHAALPGFRKDAKFSVWLYRILFNVAISRQRQLGQQWLSLAELDEPVGRCEQGAAACKGDLAWAMAQLSDPQRVAVQLCFEEGFTQEEASRVMAIPLGTLKSHINRGKAKLQSLLVAWS